MKRSLILAVVVALQLLGTLITQLLVLRIVGIGPETDAYIAAQAAPMVLGAIITTALQSVWLPRLAVLSKDLTAWLKDQSIAQAQTLILGGALILLVAITVAWWLPIVFPGLTPKQHQDATLFSLVFLGSTLFNTQSALLSVALRTRDLFLAAEVVALLGTVISLVLIYTFVPIWGLEAAVWISLLKAIVVYIIQLGFAGWPRLSLRDAYACKETWRLMKPLLFGTSIYKTSPLIDRYWASLGSPGSLTLLSLAQTAMTSLATLIDRTISTQLTPSFARYVANSDYEGLKTSYRKGLLLVTIVVIVIGVALLATKPLFVWLSIKLLKLTIDTASTLWLMCLLLLGYLHVTASGTLAVAAFYAMNDTKTPVVVGVSGFVVSIGLKSLGFLLYGPLGLVAAISLYYIGNMLVLSMKLEQYINAKLS